MSNEELVNNKPKHKKILNTSGQGKNAIVPKSVANRFNWGAFFFGWIWGIFNKVWITAIDFVLWIITIVLSNQHSPQQLFSSNFIILNILGIIGFGLHIWFGIKGNAWAWQNKKWKNPEHLHKIQKRWAIAGSIVDIILPIILILLVFTLVDFK